MKRMDISGVPPDSLTINIDGNEGRPFTMPSALVWQPQPDITVYELALALPFVMLSRGYLDIALGVLEIDPNWQIVKRHFRVVP